MFSKALDAAREDGTLSKLSIKWFTFDISPKGPGG
jgi:ABC-type amino acid transport substrate-binding protein